MSAVESFPPSLRTPRIYEARYPTLVSVAGWVLLVIAVGWLALIAVHRRLLCDYPFVALFDLARPVAGGCAGSIRCFPDGQRVR